MNKFFVLNHQLSTKKMLFQKKMKKNFFLNTKKDILNHIIILSKINYKKNYHIKIDNFLTKG